MNDRMPGLRATRVPAQVRRIATAIVRAPDDPSEIRTLAMRRPADRQTGETGWSRFAPSTMAATVAAKAHRKSSAPSS